MLRRRRSPLVSRAATRRSPTRRSTRTSMFWPKLRPWRASSKMSGRYAETMQIRCAMSLPLGGLGDCPGRAHLVIPGATELDVIAVLADPQLALGTGAHRDSSSSVNVSTNAVLYRHFGGP